MLSPSKGTKRPLQEVLILFLLLNVSHALAQSREIFNQASLDAARLFEKKLPASNLKRWGERVGSLRGGVGKMPISDDAVKAVQNLVQDLQQENWFNVISVLARNPEEKIENCKQVIKGLNGSHHLSNSWTKFLENDAKELIPRPQELDTYLMKLLELAQKKEWTELNQAILKTGPKHRSTKFRKSTETVDLRQQYKNTKKAFEEALGKPGISQWEERLKDIQTNKTTEKALEALVEIESWVKQEKWKQVVLNLTSDRTKQNTDANTIIGKLGPKDFPADLTVKISELNKAQFEILLDCIEGKQWDSLLQLLDEKRVEPKPKVKLEKQSPSRPNKDSKKNKTDHLKEQYKKTKLAFEKSLGDKDKSHWEKRLKSIQNGEVLEAALEQLKNLEHWVGEKNWKEVVLNLTTERSTQNDDVHMLLRSLANDLLPRINGKLRALNDNEFHQLLDHMNAGKWDQVSLILNEKNLQPLPSKEELKILRKQARHGGNPESIGQWKEQTVQAFKERQVLSEDPHYWEKRLEIFSQTPAAGKEESWRDLRNYASSLNYWDISKTLSPTLTEKRMDVAQVLGGLPEADLHFGADLRERVNSLNAKECELILNISRDVLDWSKIHSAIMATEPQNSAGRREEKQVEKELLSAKRQAKIDEKLAERQRRLEERQKRKKQKEEEKAKKAADAQEKKARSQKKNLPIRNEPKLGKSAPQIHIPKPAPPNEIGEKNPPAQTERKGMQNPLQEAQQDAPRIGREVQQERERDAERERQQKQNQKKFADELSTFLKQRIPLNQNNYWDKVSHRYIQDQGDRAEAKIKEIKQLIEDKHWSEAINRLAPLGEEKNMALEVVAQFNRQFKLGITEARLSDMNWQSLAPALDLLARGDIAGMKEIFSPGHSLAPDSPAGQHIHSHRPAIDRVQLLDDLKETVFTKTRNPTESWKQLPSNWRDLLSAQLRNLSDADYVFRQKQIMEFVLADNVTSFMEILERGFANVPPPHNNLHFAAEPFRSMMQAEAVRQSIPGVSELKGKSLEELITILESLRGQEAMGGSKYDRVVNEFFARIRQHNLSDVEVKALILRVGILSWDNEISSEKIQNPRESILVLASKESGKMATSLLLALLIELALDDYYDLDDFLGALESIPKGILHAGVMGVGSFAGHVGQSFFSQLLERKIWQTQEARLLRDLEERLLVTAGNASRIVKYQWRGVVRGLVPFACALFIEKLVFGNSKIGSQQFWSELVEAEATYLVAATTVRTAAGLVMGLHGQGRLVWKSALCTTPQGCLVGVIVTAIELYVYKQLHSYVQRSSLHWKMNAELYAHLRGFDHFLKGDDPREFLAQRAAMSPDGIFHPCYPQKGEVNLEAYGNCWVNVIRTTLDRYALSIGLFEINDTLSLAKKAEEDVARKHNILPLSNSEWVFAGNRSDHEFTRDLAPVWSKYEAKLNRKLKRLDNSVSKNVRVLAQNIDEHHRHQTVVLKASCGQGFTKFKKHFAQCIKSLQKAETDYGVWLKKLFKQADDKELFEPGADLYHKLSLAAATSIRMDGSDLANLGQVLELAGWYRKKILTAKVDKSRAPYQEKLALLLSHWISDWGVPLGDITQLPHVQNAKIQSPTLTYNYLADSRAFDSTRKYVDAYRAKEKQIRSQVRISPTTYGIPLGTSIPIEKLDPITVEDQEGLGYVFSKPEDLFHFLGNKTVSIILPKSTFMDISDIFQVAGTYDLYRSHIAAMALVNARVKQRLGNHRKFDSKSWTLNSDAALNFEEKINDKMLETISEVLRSQNDLTHYGDPEPLNIYLRAPILFQIYVQADVSPITGGVLLWPVGNIFIPEGVFGECIDAMLPFIKN